MDTTAVRITIAVVIGTIILAYVVGWVIKFLSRAKPSRTRQILLLLATTSKITILVVGLLCALGSAGVDTRPVIAALGLSGFALGFALKDAISNLLAGVMIVIYSPFDIGDDIEIMGSRGRVVDTNLRYTVLEGENATHLIPNSNCFTNKIIHHHPEKSQEPDEVI